MTQQVTEHDQAIDRRRAGGRDRLMSAQALAAREEHTFEVSVNIPTRAFYVIPAETNWIHLEQTAELELHHVQPRQGCARISMCGMTPARSKRGWRPSPICPMGVPDENIYLRVSFNGVELSAEPYPAKWCRRQTRRQASAWR